MRNLLGGATGIPPAANQEIRFNRGNPTDNWLVAPNPTSHLLIRSIPPIETNLATRVTVHIEDALDPATSGNPCTPVTLTLLLGNSTFGDAIDSPQALQYMVPYSSLAFISRQIPPPSSQIPAPSCISFLTASLYLSLIHI